MLPCVCVYTTGVDGSGRWLCPVTVQPSLPLQVLPMWEQAHCSVYAVLTAIDHDPSPHAYRAMRRLASPLHGTILNERKCLVPVTVVHVVAQGIAVHCHTVCFMPYI